MGRDIHGKLERDDDWDDGGQRLGRPDWDDAVHHRSGRFLSAGLAEGLNTANSSNASETESGKPESASEEEPDKPEQEEQELEWWTQSRLSGYEEP